MGSQSMDTKYGPVGAPPSHTGGISAESCPIVELRQYTLHEGERDRLINLFEQEFIEPQEALGMKIIGTFYDLDRPNRFVWLRGFQDMDSRLHGLTEFYDGDVWKAHREIANATMIDSDNVLLVHALTSAARFQEKSIGSSQGGRPGVLAATIYYLKSAPEDVAPLFEDQVKANLEEAGVPVLAWFVSCKEANNYPRLPVREGEHVLLWFGRFDDWQAYARMAGVIADAQSPLSAHFTQSPEVVRLAPTERSELR